MEKLFSPEEQRYLRAKRKVKKIRGFYLNLTCYCVVIPSLAVFNLVYTPEFLWFPFSACGWGIGLLFHGMGTFDYNPFFGQKWQQRKINEYIERENLKNK